MKSLSIRLGVYRPARWVSRRVHPDQLIGLQREIEFYRSLLPQRGLAFDVGANIGERSEALLAAGLGVVAFEPNPAVLAELRARCAHHHRWTLVQSALGREAAVADLYAHEAHGQSCLLRDWEGATVATFVVPVVTLDAAVRRFGRPDFCKIDVEGYELEVLSGLSSPIPLISFEFHLNDRSITATRDCLAILKRLGAVEVNVSPAEQSRFLLPQWIPITQFLESFPGDLRSQLPGLPYGDIFVRTPVSEVSR